MQLKIRIGRLTDLECITAIEARVFPNPWSEDQIYAELINQSVANTWVIETNENIIGYLMAHQVENEVHIQNVAIDIPFQHRGYGKFLLKSFINKFDKSTTFFLEVNKSNWNAIKLYIDLGFEEIGLQETYYEDGEDAIIMKNEHQPV